MPNMVPTVLLKLIAAQTYSHIRKNTTDYSRPCGHNKKKFYPLTTLLAYEKQEVGKPSQNAAQPCAVYDDPYRGDELRDGWAFRVGTWNVDSLTG